jgi:hypothetical protein
MRSAGNQPVPPLLQRTPASIEAWSCRRRCALPGGRIHSSPRGDGGRDAAARRTQRECPALLGGAISLRAVPPGLSSRRRGDGAWSAATDCHGARVPRQLQFPGRRGADVELGGGVRAKARRWPAVSRSLYMAKNRSKPKFYALSRVVLVFPDSELSSSWSTAIGSRVDKCDPLCRVRVLRAHRCNTRIFFRLRVK